MILYFSTLLKLGFGGITGTGIIAGHEYTRAKKQIKIAYEKEVMPNVKSIPER
jgi:hypothetical protein